MFLVNEICLSTEHTWNALTIGPARRGKTRIGWIRRPVSRVLCRPLRDAAIIPLDRPLRDGSRDLPGSLSRRRPCLLRDAGSLFGLAPGGACHAALVTKVPVRSYRTLSPLPCVALAKQGGLLSVALSLGSPPVGVTHRHVVVEPGLSSTSLRRPRPPGRLIRAEPGGPSLSGQALSVGALAHERGDRVFFKASDGSG